LIRSGSVTSLVAKPTDGSPSKVLARFLLRASALFTWPADVKQIFVGLGPDS